MAVTRLDHIAVHAQDAAATAEFYTFILGLKRGPRPNFRARGVWLYQDGEALVHVVEVTDKLPESGALNHVAFSGSDLAGFLERLSKRRIAHELCRLPEGAASNRSLQLFFRDINGTRIEVVFAPDEQPTGMRHMGDQTDPPAKGRSR